MHPERQHYVSLIKEAITRGASQKRACLELGMTARTYQRWTAGDTIKKDKRPETKTVPNNKLTAIERQQIITLCNQPDYANLPPSQIVPTLADKGEYLASEASLYRILKAEHQLHHRGRSKEKQAHKKPTTHIAKKANEVWSWDISYLPSPVRGQYFYLYLIEDIYSRKIVGWEVHDNESGEKGAALMQRTVMVENCFKQPLVLHSDNGSPMKSQTMQIKLYDLGVTPSHSRPRVSNDNPYSESLFRTLKYCPQWPSQAFQSLTAARQWVAQFASWYNTEHKHSRIKFVTPNQRHQGEDGPILAKRKTVYAAAKKRHPNRWSGQTRNWEQIGAVALNPEREEIVKAVAA